MGSAIAVIIFPYFLTDKERYYPLDYVDMGIIMEIDSFFWTWKTLPVILSYVRNDSKIEKQGVWIVKKKRLKSTQDIHRKI